MDNIYQIASEALIWFGEASDDSHVAMNTISQLSEDVHVHKSLLYGRFDSFAGCWMTREVEKFRSLRKLLSRP